MSLKKKAVQLRFISFPFHLATPPFPFVTRLTCVLDNSTLLSSPLGLTAQLKLFPQLVNFIEKFVSTVRVPLGNDIYSREGPVFPRGKKGKEEEEGGHGLFWTSGNLVMGT